MNFCVFAHDQMKDALWASQVRLPKCLFSKYWTDLNQIQNNGFPGFGELAVKIPI